MDANFWHQRWEANQIGFHQSEVNPLLVSYFPELSVTKGSRVFVPLCGKTLDIGWLLSQGYAVAGAELSELAIKQLFAELGTEPRVTPLGGVKRYNAANIEMFVGDIFDLTGTMLGPVDAVYDRAALVALPENTRSRYTRHLIDITGNAPQLLITYEYDQRLMEGPPFSVSGEEVKRHYENSYDITSLVSRDGALRGQYVARETVWRLKKLSDR